MVCGDGEYIIYTAMALRNKSFGSAQEFVWAADSSEYAVRESTSSIKLFKNFKERKSFKPEFGAENIFGGHLLGVKSVSSLAFYDWENQVRYRLYACFVANMFIVGLDPSNECNRVGRKAAFLLIEWHQNTLLGIARDNKGTR